MLVNISFKRLAFTLKPLSDNRSVRKNLLRRGRKNDLLEISRDIRSKDLFWGSQYSLCYIKDLICYSYKHNCKKRHLMFSWGDSTCIEDPSVRSCQMNKYLPEVRLRYVR